jgi:hypothetical protein
LVKFIGEEVEAEDEVVEAEEDIIIIITHQKIKVTVMMNMNMTTKTSTRTRKRPRILPFQNHQHQRQKLLPQPQQRHTTTTNTSMTRNLITMIPVVTTPMKLVKSIIVMNQTTKAVGEDEGLTVLEDDQEEVEQEEEEQDVVDTIIRRNILIVYQIVLHHPPKKITMQNTTTNRFRTILRPRIRLIQKTPPFKKKLQSQTRDCKGLQQQSTMKITKRMEESSRQIRQQQSCNQSPIFQSKCYRFRRHLATRVGKEGDQ